MVFAGENQTRTRASEVSDGMNLICASRGARSCIDWPNDNGFLIINRAGEGFGSRFLYVYLSNAVYNVSVFIVILCILKYKVIIRVYLLWF